MSSLRIELREGSNKNVDVVTATQTYAGTPIKVNIDKSYNASAIRLQYKRTGINGWMDIPVSPTEYGVGYYKSGVFPLSTLDCIAGDQFRLAARIGHGGYVRASLSW